MKNHNLIKTIGLEYIKNLEKLKKVTLIENENQKSKYNYAKGFLIKYLRENGGKLITQEKEELDGGLTFTIPVFDLTGINLYRFINTLKFANAVTFDATIDGQICISLSIPNINLAKNQK